MHGSDYLIPVKFGAGARCALGVANRTIINAGQFLQEDLPAQCVQAIVDITGRASLVARD